MRSLCSRLSVTNGWRPPFFCCGVRVGQQGSTDADHGNDRHLNPVCHGMATSSQGIPSSSIPTITTVKVTHFGSNNQLVERDCPSICLLHIQINQHIIRNEEASCEKRHSKQSECQVSAIMSAATVPCRTRLFVKWHSVHSENRKTFLKEKVKERRLISHPANQSKRIGKTWVPSVPRLTTLGKTRLRGGTHISTQHKESSAVHRSWMPKSILNGISPTLTQDKRWIWWASLSNAATDRRNENTPQFTGISQNLLSFWPVKQLNGFEGGILIKNLDFEYMCMWTRAKGKSKTLAPPFPTIIQVGIVEKMRLTLG